MQTKKEIISFASELFKRYGLKKTTMDDVARICRVGKATLYKFFRNKEELYKEILKDEMEEILSVVTERIKDIKDVKGKIKALFETEYILLRDKLNLSELLLNTSQIVDMEISKIIDEFYERQRRLIRGILAEGVENDEIVVEDVSLLSLAMMAAGQGLFSYFRGMKDEKKALKSMEYLINTLFSGIDRRGG
ncbi:MAG: TetR/AcrR family transcriptional regulator [Myxococcota bacterium]